MAFVPTIVVLLITSIGVFAAVYPSDKLNLEDYCGGTVTLPCPYSRGSAGTIRFNVMPTAFCRVNVTTYENCGSYGFTFAIYFNIRKSYMPADSKMEIYDTSTSRTLEKQWPGGSLPQTQYSNPTSAGQFLSDYDRRPEISVEYTPDRLYSATDSHEVYFDYVIIERQSSSYSTYCGALSGYVNDDFICDTTEDRVNCPSSYNDNTYSMDAAMSRQYCEPTGLSGVAIAGIVLGCLGFIAIIGFIWSGVKCVKERRRKTKMVAFTNNNYTADPTVLITTPGAAPPYPTETYAPSYPPLVNVAMYATSPENNAPQKE